MTDNKAAVHGSLFAQDMRVPLVIAGVGVTPGLARTPGGSVQAARIVAVLVGVALAGRPAAAETAVTEEAPVWISSPRQWAEAGVPYSVGVTAIDPQGQAVALRHSRRLSFDITVYPVAPAEVSATVGTGISLIWRAVPGARADAVRRMAVGGQGWWRPSTRPADGANSAASCSWTS